MDMQYETLISNVLHFNISGKPQCLDIGLLKKCIEDRKHVHSLDIQRSVALQVKKLNQSFRNNFFNIPPYCISPTTVLQNPQLFKMYLS